MATKTAAIIQSGTSNYLTPAESFNVVATDLLTPGIVGTYTATSGVAPTTGSFAVNAQGSPNMTVAVSAGQAYVSATPTGGTAQNIRVKMTSSENVTIAANSTGSTRYDWVYIKVDADKLNNPAADGTDVVTLITQRSTTLATDSNGTPANALALATVTVTNGASSIANADITDRRVNIGPTALANNVIGANNLTTSAIKLGYAAVTAITGFSSTASAQQISGLTSSVTIPPGGRSVRITAYVPNVADATTGRTVILSIWDGVVASGTQLAAQAKFINSASDTTGMTAIAVVTPSAGAKTYNVGITDQATGALSFNAGGSGISATNPAFILVEAI